MAEAGSTPTGFELRGSAEQQLSGLLLFMDFVAGPVLTSSANAGPGSGMIFWLHSLAPLWRMLHGVINTCGLYGGTESVGRTQAASKQRLLLCFLLQSTLKQINTVLSVRWGTS